MSLGGRRTLVDVRWRLWRFDPRSTARLGFHAPPKTNSPAMRLRLFAVLPSRDTCLIDPWAHVSVATAARTMSDSIGSSYAELSVKSFEIGGMRRQGGHRKQPSARLVARALIAALASSKRPLNLERGVYSYLRHVRSKA
jgi:hypothetical protein